LCPGAELVVGVVEGTIVEEFEVFWVERIISKKSLKSIKPRKFR
jgi:hypothetical protein